MIHYQLRCAGDHEFDGWFKDSNGFEIQAEAGLVACPNCGTTEVTRALMAPGIPRKKRELVATETAPSGQPAAGGAMPDSVRAALQKLRDEVEKSCDYVGTDFAAEARRIHNGDIEARGIYGESTDEEAEALEEDGIAFARIPWAPRTDS
jgi:hypothetical protein